MISVPNRLLRSNGNSISTVLIFLGASLLLSGCKPRKIVLEPSTPAKEMPVEIEEEIPLKTDVITREFESIALLLPFQLHQVRPNNVTAADLKRSELALDFYQGFELAMNELAAQGNHFDLHVLDSRDDESHASLLAKNPEVQNATLIVGPVFPREISAFGMRAGKEGSKVLQISPLAASRPSEFNLSNLVTITAPITTHIEAMAERVLHEYKNGDVIILYGTNDASSKQFLPLLKQQLLLSNRNANVREVSTEEELHANAHISGKNIVICGSDNTYQLTAIVKQLAHLKQELEHQVKLFGHPVWTRLKLPDPVALEELGLEISSSYFIDNNSTAVRSFRSAYQQLYGSAPTEFSFKGYDTAKFFGLLIQKSGENYASELTKATMEGLHNGFDFKYHSDWGFINNSLQFLTFKNGQFTRAK